MGDQARVEWEVTATDISRRAPLRTLHPTALTTGFCTAAVPDLSPGLGGAWGRGRRELTSHRKGFSPECCSECTLRDMLRLKDLPQVSQVKGMSLV